MSENLSDVTSKECSEYLVHELVSEAVGKLKAGEEVLARICGLQEYWSLAEGKLGSLGSNTVYGDDPHDGFNGDRVYMFNLTRSGENLSELPTDEAQKLLCKRLNTMVDIMKNIFADRVKNGTEPKSTINDYGIMLSLFDRDTLNAGRKSGSVSTKASTYTRASGLGTVQLTETVVSPKFLENADIVHGYNFYSLLQHVVSDGVDPENIGNAMLKKFMSAKQSKVKENVNAKEILSKLSVIERDNYDEIVALKKDGGEKIYDWFTFLPKITQKLMDALIATNVFDPTNPKLVSFAKSKKLFLDGNKTPNKNNNDGNDLEM